METVKNAVKLFLGIARPLTLECLIEWRNVVKHDEKIFPSLTL